MQTQVLPGAYGWAAGLNVHCKTHTGGCTVPTSHIFHLLIMKKQ